MASEESVAAELEAIFNFTNVSDGRELLSRLEYEKKDETNSYFIDFVKSLPVLRNFGAPDAANGEAHIQIIKGPRRKADNVLAEEKKSGAWGNVRFGKNFVYKEVRVGTKDGAELNNYYKDVLCEVVIQAILSCDPVHSDKIPKIINVFKRTPQSKSLWIQMEKMEKTFLDFITDLPPNPRPTLPGLLPYFTDLCNTLEYFQTKYGFNHRDMKPDNLMIKDGKIKLIDFGYSILTFNGKQYSGTSEGGYSEYYFSKHLDLLLMTLYLRDVFVKLVNGRLVMPKLISPPVDSMRFVKFINNVLTNIEGNKVTLVDNILSMNGKVTRKEIELSGQILAEPRELMDFLGRTGNPVWQIGYNFQGQYLNNQFTFPFATPTGFLELYNKLVGDTVKDYDSFVEEKLSKKGGGYTNKNKRKNRRNRKTMRIRRKPRNRV